MAKLLWSITLLLASSMATLLALELIIAVFDLDARQMWSTLYFVEGYNRYEGGVEVIRPSTDSHLVYELIPGARVTCLNCVHPLESKYDRITISVNRLGFRDRPREPDKPPGVFRIVVLGGSNTFGAAVSDEDTYPAIMQRQLDARYPGRFEVWNAGLSAYVMSQKIVYAEQILEAYAPDLLIFQDANDGRRAFFYKDGGFTEHFDRNPLLYFENLPLLGAYPGSEGKLHYELVRYSGLYRLIVARLNADIVMGTQEDMASTGQTKHSFDKAIADRYLNYGAWLNEWAVRRFVKRHPDTKIVILETTEGRYCPRTVVGGVVIQVPGPLPYCNEVNRKQNENLSCISLCLFDRPAEYRHLHPPSYVYETYSSTLIEMLTEMGLLPIPAADPGDPRPDPERLDSHLAFDREEQEHP